MSLFPDQYICRYLQNVFIDDPDTRIEDAVFLDKHMVLIFRNGRTPAVCSLNLPLPVNLMVSVLPMALKSMDICEIYILLVLAEITECFYQFCNLVLELTSLVDLMKSQKYLAVRSTKTFKFYIC
jgi:hypothetical protein